VTDVVITQNESIEEAVAAALEHLPLRSLVAGRRVAVKPNETWASKEDTTGITQPDTLRIGSISTPSVVVRRPARARAWRTESEIQAPRPLRESRAARRVLRLPSPRETVVAQTPVPA
jgi:hypothetical protein